MIEEIQKHKPEGATHWQAGNYYKIQDGVKQVWMDDKWFTIAIIGNCKKSLMNEAISMMCMTTL